eukprot:gene2663-1661_t
MRSEALNTQPITTRVLINLYHNIKHYHPKPIYVPTELITTMAVNRGNVLTQPNIHISLLNTHHVIQIPKLRAPLKYHTNTTHLLHHSKNYTITIFPSNNLCSHISRDTYARQTHNAISNTYIRSKSTTLNRKCGFTPNNAQLAPQNIQTPNNLACIYPKSQELQQPTSCNNHALTDPATIISTPSLTRASLQSPCRTSKPTNSKPELTASSQHLNRKPRNQQQHSHPQIHTKHTSKLKHAFAIILTITTICKPTIKAIPSMSPKSPYNHTLHTTLHKSQNTRISKSKTTINPPTKHLRSQPNLQATTHRAHKTQPTIMVLIQIPSNFVTVTPENSPTATQPSNKPYKQATQTQNKYHMWSIHDFETSTRHPAPNTYTGASKASNYHKTAQANLLSFKAQKTHVKPNPNNTNNHPPHQIP